MTLERVVLVWVVHLFWGKEVPDETLLIKVHHGVVTISVLSWVLLLSCCSLLRLRQAFSCLFLSSSNTISYTTLSCSKSRWFTMLLGWIIIPLGTISFWALISRFIFDLNGAVPTPHGLNILKVRLHLDSLGIFLIYFSIFFIISFMAFTIPFLYKVLGFSRGTTFKFMLLVETLGQETVILACNSTWGLSFYLVLLV